MILQLVLNWQIKLCKAFRYLLGGPLIELEDELGSSWMRAELVKFTLEVLKKWIEDLMFRLILTCQKLSGSLDPKRRHRKLFAVSLNRIINSQKKIRGIAVVSMVLG